LGAFAARDGLRLGHDVLAAASRLAGSRCLGQAPEDAAGSSRSAQRRRLQPRRSRQRLDRGQKGGAQTGPNPTDRGKPGTKRHILTDAQGIPLAVRLTGANVHDSRMIEEMVDAVPAVRQCWGPPRKRPAKLHADKAYDHRRCRRECRQRGIMPRIARRGIESRQSWGDIDGSSSAASPGWSASAAWTSAMSAAPTSISPSRYSVAPSSASTKSDGSVRRFKRLASHLHPLRQTRRKLRVRRRYRRHPARMDLN
jgi:hypothetical protein